LCPKQIDSKIKKNSLPRAKHGPRQRGSLPRATATGQALGKEICKNKIKNLCRGPDGWPSAKADGARLPLLSTPKLSRASLPRVEALGKEFLCRGAFFAEGQALGKGIFVEGFSLPRVSTDGPQQRVSLPSARDLALGKERVSNSESTVIWPGPSTAWLDLN